MPWEASRVFISWADVCLAVLSPFSPFLGATLIKEVANHWVSLLLWSHVWQPRAWCLSGPNGASPWAMMGHDMATPGLTLLLCEMATFSLSLSSLLCKYDQEITNLNVMVEFPSFQSTLYLGEQRLERKKSSLNASMHSHLFNRNLLGACKVLLLRLQRRIIINSQLLLQYIYFIFFL